MVNPKLAVALNLMLWGRERLVRISLSEGFQR